MFTTSTNTLIPFANIEITLVADLTDDNREEAVIELLLITDAVGIDFAEDVLNVLLNTIVALGGSVNIAIS